MALEKNALILCNAWVDDKQPNKLIRESERKGEQNHQVQKTEKEIVDLKSSVSEIKTFMTQNKLTDPSDSEIAHSAIRTTPAKEDLDGIQIRGIPESKNDDARCRQDFNDVRNVLEHINVDAAISDVKRLGKYHRNKSNTTLDKVPNPLQRRMILLSARKLQYFGKPVFLIRQVVKEEAERENLVLIRRRKLLQQGASPRNLRVRDGVLYISNGNK